MKSTLFTFLLLSLALLGCSDDENLWIEDVSPYEVLIDIQDADGNNLFSDDYHGIIHLDDLTPDITYTYKGETKPVYSFHHTDDVSTQESRSYYAHFYGVYVTYVAFADVQPRIFFGEFDGSEDQNDSVILNWPDGTHSTIEFTAKAVKFKAPDHSTKHSSKVRVDDGPWQEGGRIPVVTFVK